MTTGAYVGLLPTQIVSACSRRARNGGDGSIITNKLAGMAVPASEEGESEVSMRFGIITFASNARPLCRFRFF